MKRQTPEPRMLAIGRAVRKRLLALPGVYVPDLTVIRNHRSAPYFLDATLFRLAFYVDPTMQSPAVLGYRYRAPLFTEVFWPGDPEPAADLVLDNLLGRRSACSLLPVPPELAHYMQRYKDNRDTVVFRGIKRRYKALDLFPDLRDSAN